MLEIGKQIKQLREERQLTGKDLARRIGLSQSQMSRLEQGQRRIDTEILVRIADALEVSPAHFFGDADTPLPAGAAERLTLRRQRQLSVSRLHVELGKVIRSERRRRHLTIDDLARKTGHTRAYVTAVEEGRRNGLDGDFLRKALRLLAIDPFQVIEMEEQIIRDLKTRVHHLDHLVRSSGLPVGDDASGIDHGGIPLLIGDESIYPVEFDDAGQPVAAVEGYLALPDLSGTACFAVRVVGEAMCGRDHRGGFLPGDVVVFSTERSARSGEYAFVRHGEGATDFRQLFHDDGQIIRLQAIDPEVPPILVEIPRLLGAYPLVASISVRDDAL